LNARSDAGKSIWDTSRFRLRLPKLGRAWSAVLIAIGAIVLVAGLTVLGDAGRFNNKIHSGISVDGQDMGGRTEDEATAELAKYVQRAQLEPITLTSGDQTWTVMPEDVGTNIDTAGAVSAALAYTRENGFFADLGRKFKLYTNGYDIPLEGTIDATKMDAVLASVAQDLDVQPIDATLVITNGQIQVVESQEGRAVDQVTLRQQLKDLVLSLHATELPVPMMVTEPEVVAADLEPVVEQARAMAGSPVLLTSGEQTWTLTPEQILSYMDAAYEEVNGVSTPVPYLSASKMTDLLAGIAPLVAVAAVDATFANDGTKAWVVDGIDGKVLDPEKTAEALTVAAGRTTGRTAEVALMASDPNLTTEEAEAMGIKDLLAKYTTPPYWGSANRRVNVRVATGYCSNVFMAPGDEYNADEQIGPRTEARGFKLAPGIVSLGTLEDVLGGGICQVSTTLFNAVFFAGIEVVERHNHSIYIDHYPDGRDATVTANGKNFIFRNDTANYLWIVGESDGVTTTFYIYGTNDGRTVDYTFSGFYDYTSSSGVKTIEDPALPTGTSVVEDSGHGGKSCLTTRVVTYADGTTKTDKFYSIFPPTPRTVRVGTGATTTLPPTTVPPTTVPPTTVPSTTEATSTTLGP
jgi:vancomycin resistance protein YoaR